MSNPDRQFFKLQESKRDQNIWTLTVHLNSPASTKQMATNNTLVISVVSVNKSTDLQTQTYFKVKQSTKMKKLIDCYAKREGIHSPNDVCFFIKKTTDEHERPVLCEEQMTPSSLLLQEGDKIWCSADRKGMP